MCVIPKISEAAMYRRPTGKFGPELGARQYAYRRARGAGTHMLKLYDFMEAAYHTPILHQCVLVRLTRGRIPN